jgi:hypothetical protein
MEYINDGTSATNKDMPYHEWGSRLIPRSVAEQNRFFQGPKVHDKIDPHDGTAKMINETGNQVELGNIQCVNRLE